MRSIPPSNTFLMLAALTCGLACSPTTNGAGSNSSGSSNNTSSATSSASMTTSGSGSHPSSSAPSSGPPVGDWTVENACLKMQRLNCELLEQCLPSSLAASFGDLQGCITYLSMMCRPQVDAELVDAGLITFNGAAGFACENAVHAGGCQAAGAAGAFQFPVACSGVWNGSLPPGADCLPVASQGQNPCRNGVCNHRGPCNTFCEAVAPIGGACGDPTPRCPDGAACYQGTCWAAVPPGSACSQGPCRLDSYCDLSDGGVCTRYLQEGDGCQETDNHCAPGLTCLNGTCRLRLPEGSSCHSANTCENPLACLLTYWDGGAGPRCARPLPLGAPCQSLDTCDDGLACEGGTGVPFTCVRPGNLGEPCLLTCALGSCSTLDHTCHPLGMLDDPCGAATGWVACESGLLCDLSVSTCQLLHGVGGECAYSECLPQLACDTSGHCVERAPLGQPCDGVNNPFGQGNTCQAGLLCDQTTHLCRSKTPDGAPCQDLNECLTQRCTNLVCGCQ